MYQPGDVPVVAVRPFRAGDAAELALICRRSVMVAGSRYYSQPQIEAWHSVLPDADILANRYADGRTALVAVDVTDRPSAFGDVEQNGHIQYFYCSPEAIGHGIGRLLFSKLAAAAAHQKPERMFVEASESALGFFKRCGFEVIGRRDLRIGSVAIHNYEMARNLAVGCDQALARPGSM